MPQSYSTTSPIEFLALSTHYTIPCPSEEPIGIYVSAVLMVTSGCGPCAAWHGCRLIFWTNKSQDSAGPTEHLHGHHMGPARESPLFSILYKSRMGCVWGPLARPVNSLAPGRSQCDFENVIFNLALLIGIFKSTYENVLRWMPQNLSDDKSTLVQVMAWCRQATSHYLNQFWPRNLPPYGVTRPQWVKTWTCGASGHTSRQLICSVHHLSKLPRIWRNLLWYFQHLCGS